MDDKDLVTPEAQNWGFPYGLTLVISTNDDGDTCLAIHHDVSVNAPEKPRPFRRLRGIEAGCEIASDGEPTAISRWFGRLRVAIRNLAPASAAQDLRAGAPHLIDRAR